MDGCQIYMKKDMTYNLVDYEKSNVNSFIEKLKEISLVKNSDLQEADCSFFSVIAKEIIFLKYFLFSLREEKEKSFLKSIISDLYFLILSIIQLEQRYIYVNVRSIIENYIRLITSTTLEDSFITKDIFENVKRDMTSDEYSLIRSEYRVACNYVHGGDLLSDDLAFVLSECFVKSGMTLHEKNAFYCRMKSILKIFNGIIIKKYAEQVNGCFHRTKSLMAYLLGQNNVDLLFVYLNHKE